MINLEKLSRTFQAWQTCVKLNNTDWAPKHAQTITDLLQELPSGSGIDCGMQFDWDASKPQRLVFTFSFHHMDEHGSYDGWTDHELIITPAFFGFELKITGKDRNNVKDYLYSLFNEIFQ